VRRGAAEVEPLEVEIEFEQRLAGEIDRGPAVEGGVAEHARQAVDHHGRTVEPDPGLGRHRRLQLAWRLEHDLDRNILPLQRRRRHRRVDVEFERMIVCLGTAGDPDLAVGVDDGFGVDGLEAIFHAVAQVGKNHRAVGHRDAVDRGVVGATGSRRRPGR
jgi:hypothetical protein